MSYIFIRMRRLLFYFFILFSSYVSSKNTATVSECFVLKLNRDDFQFKISSIDEETPIRFSASLVGNSDLPTWMFITQQSLQHDPYIYGTPRESDHGRTLKIQVLAMNPDTYELAKHKLTIRIKPKKYIAVYELELPILNLDIAEFLSADVRDELISRLLGAWNKASDLYYTHISSLLEEGWRVPAGDNAANGVLVRVGSRHRFSNVLRYVKVNTSSHRTPACHQVTGGGRTRLRMDERDLVEVRRAVSVDEMLWPAFEVDWCRVRLLTKGKEKDEVDEVMESQEAIKLRWERLEEQERMKLLSYNEPISEDDFPDKIEVSPRDFVPEIILCLILPLLLLIILSVLLTCIFFCKRDTKSNRADSTPAIQLAQYNNIRQASNNLRSLTKEHEDASSSPARTESAPPPYQSPTPKPSSPTPATEETVA